MSEPGGQLLTSNTSLSYPNGDPLSSGTTSSSPSSEIPDVRPSTSATQPRENSGSNLRLKVSTPMPKPVPVVLPTEEDILPSPDEPYPNEQADHKVDEEIGNVMDGGDIEDGVNFGSKNLRLTRLQLLDDRNTPTSSSSSETLLNTATPVYTRGVNSLDSDTLDSRTPILSRSDAVVEPVLPPLNPLSTEPQQETGGNQPETSKVDEDIPETNMEELQTTRLVTNNPENVALIDVEQDGDPFIVASDASTSSRPNSTSSATSVKSIVQTVGPPVDVS